MAAIIFDFDGTIADSFDYVSDFMVKSAGLPPLTDAQKEQLRGLSMREMTQRLGYQWWEAAILFFKGRRRMRKAIRHLDSFEGMPELIRKLHAEGHQLFIVSTNSVRNLHSFLHRHKIHTYFLQIYGGAGMLNKAPTLKRLLEEQNFKTNQAVYIGDEMRDIEAAKSIGMRAIAVTWGFAGRKNLARLRPTALVDTPEQLLRILEDI